MGDPVVALRRPFNWGILLVMDATTSDIPQHLGDAGIARSPQCLVVRVRHAQDVDGEAPFEVSVSVAFGTAGDAQVEHLLDVPSGTITVGDADGEARVDIGATACLVGVELAGVPNAHNVGVWLSPR